MNDSGKTGLEGGLEDAVARGLKLKPQSTIGLEQRLEASMREVETLYTPETPARLKLGRPCKADGRQASRMKGVRLDVAFLARLEVRLAEERLTFSGLVQDLLGTWLGQAGLMEARVVGPASGPSFSKAPAASPGKPARS